MTLRNKRQKMLTSFVKPAVKTEVISISKAMGFTQSETISSLVALGLEAYHNGAVLIHQGGTE